MLEVKGEVSVDSTLEEAWDLFSRFGEVASLIPTVERVEVDGDDVRAQVRVKLGILTVSSRVNLHVIERQPLVCIKAEGVSYLGETITEQMAKRKVKGIDTDSVGHLLLKLNLRPGDGDSGIVIAYAAEVEAEGRLRRIYQSILKSKAPKMMEDFAQNLRKRLESGESAAYLGASSGVAARGASRDSSKRPASKEREKTLQEHIEWLWRELSPARVRARMLRLLRELITKVLP